MLDVSDDAIGLYLHYLKQGGLRILIYTFFLRLLKATEVPCDKVLAAKEKKKEQAASKATVGGAGKKIYAAGGGASSQAPGNKKHLE